MSIDIKKFVNVTIDYAKEPQSISVRDTAVLITSEGNAGVRFLATSYDMWKDHAASGTFTNTDVYVSTFFAHGGAKLLILEQASATDALTLDDNYILVAVVNQTLNAAKTLAVQLDTNLKDVHRKLLLARATSTDIATDPLTKGIDSLIVKYSETLGAEMAIAAYLTKIDIYGTNTVHDYAFTTENIQQNIAPAIDDAMFDLLISYNFNFNIPLAGATRNIGGNTTSGRAITNEYLLIVMQQTITEQVLQLLVTKIKGNTALAALRTTITQELNNYVQNGYLSTNKSWDLEDWNVSHNGQTFTVISKHTQLTLGYWVQVLPWSALSTNEIAGHAAPPIYIVVSDSYGIRQINLFGEVV